MKRLAKAIHHLIDRGNKLLLMQSLKTACMRSIANRVPVDFPLPPPDGVDPADVFDCQNFSL